jgi:hypothetical protein
METQPHTDPQISPRHRTRPLQSPLGPAPPRPADSHKHTPTHRSRLDTGPASPASTRSWASTAGCLPHTMPSQQLRERGERQPPRTRAAKQRPRRRRQPAMARAVPGNDESPKQSTQPVRNQQMSGHPNNQPVRIVRTTNQSQPNKPSSALPVGTTWCLATTIVRTTNQSESSEQPTSRNPTNRVAHFRWEPPGALLPPTSMRSETGKGVGQCIPRQRVGGGIRRRAPH